MKKIFYKLLANDSRVEEILDDISFMYFSEAKFDSTLGLDIKSISISNAGILVFLSTENFFDTFTPLFKVFIAFERLVHMFLDNVYTLLFSS